MTTRNVLTGILVGTLLVAILSFVGQIDLEAVPVLEAWTVRSEADTGAEEAHAVRYARMTSLEQECR